MVVFTIGCGIKVISNPSGAKVYHSNRDGNWEYKGKTPIELSRTGYVVEKAYVVWPDGTKSVTKTYLDNK
jgi:hypothetical protein